MCGSIPFGVLIARMKGVNLQASGSGNIGASNAARTLGKKLGVLVLLGDTLKAYLPLVIAKRIFRAQPELDWILVSVAFAAFLGHIYSPWLRFKGGKGVATGFGVFLALSPWVALAAAIVWAILYFLTHTASVGSLAAATALVPTLAILRSPRSYLYCGAAMYVLILWRHRANILRLVHREENKV